MHVQFEGDESWVEFGIESDSTHERGLETARPCRYA
jgi:hypothetical protein